MLALQRTAGNRAVASLLRQAAPETAPPAPASFDVPVQFVATPIDDAPQPEVKGWSELLRDHGSGPATAAGTTANVAAHGEHGWLAGGGANARRMGTWQYWSPMVPGTGPRQAVVLERLVRELPRDLTPQVVAQLQAETQRLAAEAAGRPQFNMANPANPTGPQMSWSQPNPVHGSFSGAELQNVPELVRRLNAGTATPEEIALLKRMAEYHVGGATTGSPMTSYTLPGGQPSVGAGGKRFRVRVEMDPNVTLDISSDQAKVAKALGFANPQEAEVIAVTDDALRIISVEKAPAAGGSSALGQAGAIRWAGRGLLVVSAAMSVAHVAGAPEGKKGQAVAEEAGAQLGGFAGAAAASAFCVGVGLSTGGLGLLLCGLVGGVGGGVGGALLGGELAKPSGGDVGALPNFEQPTAPDPADPFGLGLNAAPRQTATLLDFLATPEVTGQLSAGDYGVIGGWLGAR